MKDADKTLSAILDIGRDMTVAGSDVWEVEEVLLRILDAYGFSEPELWIISSLIECSVKTRDGGRHTQVKRIDYRKYDMEKLEQITALSQEACLGELSPEEIEKRLKQIKSLKVKPLWHILIASALGAGNFTMFYNGYRQDVMIVGFTALLIAAIRMRIGEREDNPLILNTVLAFIMEVIIITTMLGGIGRSLTSMTAGLIILLISGIGLTNGVKDLLHKNYLSGLSDFMNSLLGAMGISIGISLALLVFGEDVLSHIKGQEVVASQLVQIIACVGGCIGFALLYNAKGRVLIYSGVGAALVWLAYVGALRITEDNYFTATLMAACFSALYGNAAGLLSKAPVTIYLTTCIFPLIPGAKLYSTVYAIIMDDRQDFHSNGRALFLICIAISLGYIIIEVVIKYGSGLIKKYFGRRRPAE